MTNALINKGITLTFFQSLILQRIAEHTPCTAHSLVMVTKKDKAQITRLINELIKQGMVTREKNPTDKRELILSLTEKGAACSREILDIRATLSQKMVAGMTPEQQVQLLALLELMESNLAC